MGRFQTDQERFWAGEFGDEYASRNQGANLLASNLAFFSRILKSTEKVSSVIEFGANIGMNIKAMKELLPIAEFSAIEINSKAVSVLEDMEGLKVYPQSILEFAPDYLRDLVLIKGVLIHINPEILPEVYRLLYQTTKRYICVAEYYNPTPVEINYRGHKGKLFKRDFVGDILDRFPDLRLIDYGFVYHRDANFPQDDITWFLLEKISKD